MATMNQQVSFEVKSISKSSKDGFADVEVMFIHGPNKYYNVKYTRKVRKEHTNWQYRNMFKVQGKFSVVIDGCAVMFDETADTNEYRLDKVERLYDTAGVKKLKGTGNYGKNSQAKDTEEAEEDAGKVAKAVPETPANAVLEIVEKDKWGNVKHEQFGKIKMCLENNIPVYLAGPAGSGKNFTVEQIAEELGWDFFFSNSVQQEFKMTGFIDAGGKFHDTEFYRACVDENDCIFFLDEMDASIPEVLVLLNAAIANGYFEFPNGRVDLQHVHFVAAGNTVGNGADEDYTGRMVIDQATLDRFAIIEFDYDERVELQLADGNKQLVEFIHQIRKSAEQNGVRATFSYRCITMVTKLEKSGMELADIIKIVVVKGLDRDTIMTLHADSGNKYAASFEKAKRIA